MNLQQTYTRAEATYTDARQRLDQDINHKLAQRIGVAADATFDTYFSALDKMSGGGVTTTVSITPGKESRTVSRDIECKMCPLCSRPMSFAARCALANGSTVSVCLACVARTVKQLKIVSAFNNARSEFQSCLNLLDPLANFEAFGAIQGRIGSLDHLLSETPWYRPFNVVAMFTRMKRRYVRRFKRS